MKPHDETWSAKPSGGGMLEITSDTDGPALLGYDPRQIGVWPEQDVARVALIAAAPEMARALLAMHKSITFEERTAARLLGDEALKKAGAL